MPKAPEVIKGKEKIEMLREKPKLKRALGLFEVTAYGVGIILGAGIYALIGKGAAVAGNALWMAFLIGAAIAALTGLSYAELGSLFPKEAAEYVYSKKAFRSKLIPFLIGWLIIITGTIAGATVALGFGGYFYAITGINPIIAAGALIIILSTLNFYGIKESARVNILFTVIEAAGLLFIIFLGISFFGSVNYFELPSTGFMGVMGAAVLLFFAFIGFEDIVNLAEETRKPRKVIPKALIISVIVTAIVYVLVSISVVSILPWETLGQSAAPLADVSEAALPGSHILLSFIALFATANTVLILLIVESRMIWGMAREKSLPKILSTIHPTRKTPWVAILFTMVLAILFMSSGNIKVIAEITDIGVFLIYFSVNMSLIWLRYRRPGKRVFRVPINIGKFPVLPALGAIFSFGMLFFFTLEVILIGIVIISLGFLVYKVLHR